MRKLTLLLAGLLISSVGWAKPVAIITTETVRLQIANWNTWLMCTLPEVWNAKNPDEVLNQSAESDDAEKRWIFATYVRTYYQMTEYYFSDEKQLEELYVGGHLENKYASIVSQFSEEEKKKTLVNSCDEDWASILLQKRKKLGYIN